MNDETGAEHQLQWVVLRTLLQSRAALESPAAAAGLCSALHLSRQRKRIPAWPCLGEAQQTTQTPNTGEEVEDSTRFRSLKPCASDCCCPGRRPPSTVPVLFDAVGERISPATIFSFGHSVFSTAHGHVVLFKGVCCHSFQASQGSLGLGTCHRRGSW